MADEEDDGAVGGAVEPKPRKHPTVENGILTFYYPLPIPKMQCPGPKCNKSYASVAQSSKGKDRFEIKVLRDHFKKIHAEIQVTIRHVCNICNDDITLLHQKNLHECLLDTTTRTPEDYTWLCNQCDRKFIDPNALSSHKSQSHVKPVLTFGPPIETPTTSTTPTSSQSTPPFEPNMPSPSVKRSQNKLAAMKQPIASPSSPLTPAVVAPSSAASTSTSLTPTTPTSSKYIRPKRNIRHKRDAVGKGKLPTPNVPVSVVPPNVQDDPMDIEENDEDIDVNEQPEVMVDCIDFSNEEEPVDLGQKLIEWIDSLYYLKSNDCSPKRWDQFERNLAVIIKEIQQELKIDTAWRDTHEYRKVDTKNPTQMKNLYYSNPKRAMNVIKEVEPKICNADRIQIRRYFERKMKLETRPVAEAFFTDYHMDNEHRPIKNFRFTSAEVVTRLKKFRNTAPGPDKLQYRHWALIDPEGDLLTDIFNICIKYCKVPSTWKTSKTFLYAKKDKPTTLNDWRPISLMPTIYKLYTALLAQKIKEWCDSKEIIHLSQKGSSEHDVLLEHSYLIDLLIRKAKNPRKSICFAFLDIKQAFQSVPTNAVILALEKSGIGDKITPIVTNLLTGRTTDIITGRGTTTAIPVDRGLLMGDPISSILFNIVLNYTILTLNTFPQLEMDLPYRVLADIDDLAVFSKTEEELQKKVDAISNSLRCISLKLNSDKCVALKISNKSTEYISIVVNETPIRCLTQSDHHKYIGVKIGYYHKEEATPKVMFHDQVLRIMKSQLSGWQKVDAIRQFVMPAIQHQLRMGRGGSEGWKDLDNAIRHDLKRAMDLPQSAPEPYFYGSRKFACLAFPNCENDFHAYKIVNAYKLLWSKDPAVRKLAGDDLSYLIVGQKLSTKKEDHQMSLDFFNSKLTAKTDPKWSVWTTARISCDKENIIWSTTDEGVTMTLSINNVPLTFSNRNLLLRELRERKRIELSTILTDPLQYTLTGTSLHTFSLSSYSNSFFSNCQNDKDWYFIHRARLHLTSLRGSGGTGHAFKNENEKKCRKCGDFLENIDHVLNNCANVKTKMLDRHNGIVALLKKKLLAKGFTVLSENQPLPDVFSSLKPDLCVAKENIAYIIDVAIPFDKTQYKLKEAAARKHNRYDALVAEWKELKKSKYRTVELIPFIVGSRGAWYLDNQNFLKKIIYDNKERALFSKTCVNLTIRWSRCILEWFKSDMNIYVENGWPDTRTGPPENVNNPGSSSNSTPPPAEASTSHLSKHPLPHE